MGRYLGVMCRLSGWLLSGALARAEDLGSSSNLFVLDQLTDDTYFIFRANLATRDGVRDPFFGYVDANIRYRLDPQWFAEVGYRHAALELSSGLRQEYRPMLGLRWQGRLGGGHLSNRHRLEGRFFEGGAQARVRYRNETKWMASQTYTDFQIAPFVEEEFFFDLKDSDLIGNWLTFGVSNRWAKGRKWKLGYRLQSRKTGQTWSDRHVLVLGVSLLNFK